MLHADQCKNFSRHETALRRASMADPRHNATHRSRQHQVHDDHVEDILERWNAQREQLTRFCMRYLDGNRADAEDAIGRATLVILERGWVTSDVRNPDAWFRKIVYSACMDQHRGRRHRRVSTWTETAGESSQLERSSRETAIIDPAPDAECAYIHNETIMYARQVIRELPQQLRLPFFLRICHGVAYAELARQMHINELNLRKQVQTARQIVVPKLRRYLEGSTDIRVEPATVPHNTVTSNHASLDLAIADLQPTTIHLRSGEQYVALLPVGERPTTWSQAREHSLMRYIEKHPTGWRRQLELAEMLLFAGRNEEAFDRYRELVVRGKTRAHVKLRFIEALGAAGRKAEAHTMLDQLMSMRMSQAEGAHVRGRLALACRDWQSAVQAFHRAAEQKDTPRANGALLGYALVSSGRPDAAMATLEDVLAATPHDVMALWLSHDAATSMGYHRRPHQLIELAVELDPESVPAILRLAMRSITEAMATGRTKNAEKLVQQLGRLAPNLAETYACRALLLHAQGKSEEAETLLCTFAATHPRDPRVGLALARILFVVGKKEKALEAIREAMILDTNDLEICEEAVRILAVLQPRDTPALVEEILRRAPEHGPILAMAARALAARGGMEAEAIEIAKRAVKVCPRWPMGWLSLGTLLASLGQHEEVMENLERGMSMLPPEDEPEWASWVQRFREGFPVAAPMQRREPGPSQAMQMD